MEEWRRKERRNMGLATKKQEGKGDERQRKRAEGEGGYGEAVGESDTYTVRKL